MRQLIRWLRFPLGILGCVLFSIQVPAVWAEILATFDGSEQGWTGYAEPVKAVSTPSTDDRGALEVTVALSGRGWSDITVESPELNRDFSKYGELRVSVFAPGDVPSDVKVQVFAKSGSQYTWSDGGWQPLSMKQWKVIALPIARIAHPNQIRTVGIKVGGNSRFNGSILLDRVEISGSSGAAGEKEKQIAIEIIEVVENSRIIGRVFGIPPDRVSEYQVLVYVKTDKWYIHPYERGGEGLSFASINREGFWQIETVKRRFLADSVAALVVRKGSAAPSQVDDLRQITSEASYTRPGGGKL